MTIEGFRLSPQQRRVWLLQEHAPQAYYAQCALLLKGPLDTCSLKAVMAQVVQRHEILHTSFHRLSGMSLPLQVVEEDCRLVINESVAEELDANEQQALVALLLNEARQVPLDLSLSAPLKAWLIKFKENEHVLALSLPALYSDATGLLNLAAEISRGYDAALRGEGLAGEPMQYVDISEWQNALLVAENAEVGREYWRRQNLDVRHSLKLPYQREDIETNFTPQFVSITLNIANVEARCRQYETTPSVFFLTCWQVLLWRLTAQPQFVTGIAVDGRNYPGLESALGLFAKYLPVSLLCERNMRFHQLLKRVEQTVSEAAEYQEYFTWEEVEHPPFFPFCFDYEHRTVTYASGAVSFSVYQQYVCAERFNVRLSVAQHNNAMRARLYYDVGMYEPGDMTRLAAEFETLVRSALQQPEARLGALEIVGPQERAQQLVSWNQTARAYPSECVHELFARQAAETPARIAVVSEAERLTYGELNERANRLARHLQGLGVGAEVRVGLWLERSVELLVGVLGILKAGGAYVPLDPQYPRERVRYMLGDSGAAVLVTEQRLLAGLPEHEAQVVLLDSERELLAQLSGANPESRVTGENLAYVIYTSGSTGAPKGVLVTHQNLVHSTTARIAYYAEEVGSYLLLSSFSFDSSVAGIFWTLCTGGTLVLPGDGMQRDPRELARLIEQHEVTHLLGLPSLYAAILAARRNGELNSLKTVIVAGEACRSELVERHYEESIGAQLYNEYGPTEASVWTTVYACKPMPPGHAISIGRVISNAQIYVVDDEQRVVPIGVAGELYIGGAGVARGYQDRADVTAEKFVPDPFSAQAGSRLYRTGDIGRYRPDGNIEFLGRVDNQVKIRGYRIELGEIEAVLAAYPGLTEVAVVAREDAPGEQRLVAYVSGPAEITISEWRKYLEERLPEYMVPMIYVLVPEMPLTANGKVDCRALPAPEAKGFDAGEEYVRPQSQIEELLAGIWAEVLGVPEVSVTANFFELGGHSLLATQVVSRVREACQVELPVRSLFSSPIVRELAETVAQALKGEQTESAPPLQRVDRAGQLPLSYAQQRLWFAEQLSEGRALYNVPVAVRLSGELDVAALAKTLREVVRRHEVLRTSFPEQQGKPLQVIAAEVGFELPLTDLSELAVEEREAEAQRLAQAEAERPFDLAHGPLLRGRLLKLGEAEHFALFTMHHIVSDGWSMGVLIKEVSVLYEAYSRGAESPLAELEFQYADYAVWQREWLQGAVLEEQLGYWGGQLRGAPEELQLPVDRARPAVQGFHGAMSSIVITPDVSLKLKELSRREDVTLFMSFLTVFKLLLHYYSGQDDIVVGTNVANRNRSETEALIGFFVNTLVMRTELSGDPTFLELLKRVRETCLEAYAHQELPFESVVAMLQPERDLSRQPLFQVKIDVDNHLLNALELPRLSITPLEISLDIGRCDLQLFVTETHDGLLGKLVYDKDLFDEATVKVMSKQFEILLDRIVAQPDIRLTALEAVLAHSEKQHKLTKQADYKNNIRMKFAQVSATTR